MTKFICGQSFAAFPTSQTVLYCQRLRPGLLVVRRQQSLVNAYGGDARLDGLLVERVHELLVIESPERAELGRREGIADGVPLPAVGPDLGDAPIHLGHPGAFVGSDHRMTEQAPRAGDTVDGRARGRDLVVGQQIPRRIIEGRAREERHLGIAVDVDLLDEVLELVAGEVVVAGQRGIPVLAGVLREVEEAGLAEIVPHEVHLIVEDELAGERIRALVGDARRLRLGAGHVENGAEDFVHGEERRSHARRCWRGSVADPCHERVRGAWQDP